MRRKKTDYTGHYSPNTIKATLSSGVGKHKEDRFKTGQFNSDLLKDYSSLHTSKYSQYRFNRVGVSVFIIISQCGKEIFTKNHQIRLGSIGTSGTFELATKIYVSEGLPDTDIFTISEFLAVDVNTLLRQLRDFAASYCDPSDRIAKFETKIIKTGNTRPVKRKTRVLETSTGESMPVDTKQLNKNQAFKLL